MATIPVPTTWTTGQMVTSAELNAEIRDAMNFLASPPRCIAYRAAGLSVATSTWTRVDHDTTIVDTDTMHNSGTNPSRLTIHTSGYWWLQGNVHYGYQAHAAALAGLEIRKNSAGSETGGTQIVTSVLYASTNPALGTGVSPNAPITLSAGDYIEMFVYQSTAAALSFGGTLYDCTLQAVWKGTS